MSRWTRSGSASWRPHRSTGFSAEVDWNDSEIRFHRTARQESSSSDRRSVPPRVTEPSTVASGASPSMARAKVDLPDPDSPRTPRHSPGATDRLMPPTARTAGGPG
jgi:hypothetical protein